MFVYEFESKFSSLLSDSYTLYTYKNNVDHTIIYEYIIIPALYQIHNYIINIILIQ